MPKDFKEKFPSREPTDISLARFTAEKSAVAQISLTYMKRLITPTYLTLASPGGMAVPYEGGYCCLALMARDWTNEKALVKNILDKFASLQNSDGSWYQQIYPWGANSEYEDRKVDSGASLIAWAMADYDQRNASTTYQSNWQAAMRFLKTLEWVPGAAGKSILKNQVINGVKEEVSFAADVSEAILAGVRGLDAYGSTIQFGDGDTEQVRDFISRLVAGIDEYHWKSDYEWYQTEYPLGAQSEAQPGVFITFEQLISYTQALCAWALKKWDDIVAGGLPINGMVPNSGFENDFESWDQNDSVIDTVEKHWGAKSSKLSVVVAEGQKEGARCYAVPINLTLRYKLSIFYHVLSLTSGTYRLRIIFHNSEHSEESIVSVLDVTEATLDWTEVSKIVSGESTADIIFPSWTDHIHLDSLWLADSEGDAYTDDYLFYVLHETNIKKALDRAIVGTAGRFGGFIYHGTWNYTDPTEEYPHYAALMRIAMNLVDSTRYAKWISAALDFMRKAALSDGQVLDRVLSTGMAYVNPEAWGPLLVTCASCILAGA